MRVIDMDRRLKTVSVKSFNVSSLVTEAGIVT